MFSFCIYSENFRKWNAKNTYSTLSTIRKNPLQPLFTTSIAPPKSQSHSIIMPVALIKKFYRIFPKSISIKLPINSLYIKLWTPKGTKSSPKTFKNHLLSQEQDTEKYMEPLSLEGKIKLKALMLEDKPTTTKTQHQSVFIEKLSQGNNYQIKRPKGWNLSKKGSTWLYKIKEWVEG